MEAVIGAIAGAAATAGAGACFSFLKKDKTKNAEKIKNEQILTQATTTPSKSSEVPLKGERNGPKVSSKARLTEATSNLEDIGMAGAKLNVNEFVDLLSKLVGETKNLQNNPKMGIHPEEALAARHVLSYLKPYGTESGGPLIIEELIYVKNRPNIKITLPGTMEGKYIGFVGSHLDVVPANPELWERDPFVLTVEGDRCYGRGSTDCLCHVALLSCLLKDLCEKKTKLNRSVVVVFIAGEEGGENGVGVDKVVEAGKIAELAGGEPVYWIDAADSQPCAGTFGVLQWSLKASGRLYHSGMPNKTVNPIELLHESMKKIQERFYKEYGPRYEEKRWGFIAPSSMKPTQQECAKGSLNQIPPWATLAGDIRISPFYDILEVMDSVEKWVEELNENIEEIPTRGPSSKYVLNDPEIDFKRGKIELTWGNSKDEARSHEGIACDLNSNGHKALVQATVETLGAARPYSVSGSLPLVRSLQRQGFNLNLDGFGLMSTYHANNEYCLIPDMIKAHEILLRILTLLDNDL